MAYDDPENATAEVQLEATVDGSSMTGNLEERRHGGEERRGERDAHGLEALTYSTAIAPGIAPPRSRQPGIPGYALPPGLQRRTR